MPDSGHTPEHKEQADSAGAVRGPSTPDIHDHAAEDHGHESAAVPADVIPEKSWQDSLLVAVAVGVMIAFTGMIGYWLTLPLPPITAEMHGE
jgi:hypothetical protein